MTSAPPISHPTPKYTNMSKRPKTITIPRTERDLPIEDFLAMLPEAKLRDLCREFGAPIGKLKRATANNLAHAMIEAGAEITISIRRKLLPKS